VAHTVGAAAKAVGVSAKAIRIWEAKGLLPPTGRTEAGYRVFSDDDIEILRFICRSKTLGLTLPEIKSILDLHRQGTAPCEQVTAVRAHSRHRPDDGRARRAAHHFGCRVARRTPGSTPRPGRHRMPNHRKLGGCLSLSPQGATHPQAVTRPKV